MPTSQSPEMPIVRDDVGTLGDFWFAIASVYKHLMVCCESWKWWLHDNVMVINVFLFPIEKCSRLASSLPSLFSGKGDKTNEHKTSGTQCLRHAAGSKVFNRLMVQSVHWLQASTSYMNCGRCGEPSAKHVWRLLKYSVCSNFATSFTIKYDEMRKLI